MKTAFFFLLAGFGFSYAQIGIGNTAPANASVSIEFETANLGLILPYVSNATHVSGAVNGTLIYDRNDQKVKVFQNSAWQDLSVVSGSVLTSEFNIQTSLADISTAKVAIGTESTTPGILVLEDTNKAMVLPKVASPHLNIINPSPGLIVFDTVKKQLVVFNGTQWTFWE